MGFTSSLYFKLSNSYDFLFKLIFFKLKIQIAVTGIHCKNAKISILSNNPKKGFACLATAAAIMPKINITISAIKEFGLEQVIA
jgi:hypothetical protein